MESGSKKAAAGVLALLLLQLMVAPTTATSRLLQQADTSPLFGLDIIAREFGHPDGTIVCSESCVFLPCVSSVFGCRCENKVCVHD
ncbi:Circulin-D [Zea mays]|uniref:Circulin-D n=1 Tax=Zea mays TaxID=4577 RepID=A0A3L6FJL5_MAIZE|nr:Circulin-D [Zea mays]PWZ33427.1 Circulin-D [Zea mays]